MFGIVYWYVGLVIGGKQASKLSQRPRHDLELRHDLLIIALFFAIVLFVAIRVDVVALCVDIGV